MKTASTQRKTEQMYGYEIGYRGVTAITELEVLSSVNPRFLSNIFNEDQSVRQQMDNAVYHTETPVLHVSNLAVVSYSTAGPFGNWFGCI